MRKTPKKSESLEIRLPHAAKQAFMDRCRLEGRSASAALRGFIEASIAQPSRRVGRLPLRLLTAGVAVAALGAVAAPSLAHPSPADAFARIDLDHDGFISRAELVRASQVQMAVSIGGRALATEDAQARTLLVSAAFDRADADHDGRIDFAEFRKAWGR